MSKPAYKHIALKHKNGDITLVSFVIQLKVWGDMVFVKVLAGDLRRYTQISRITTLSKGK